MIQRIQKFHPKTGKVIAPLGFTKRGKAIWPVLGASPDDDSNDDGTGGDDDGEDGGAGSEGGSKDDNGGKAKTYSAEEYEALDRRMRAADKRASEAEKKVKEREDKDKDESTRNKEAAEAKEAENSTLKAENLSLKAKVAFLTTTEHNWHNPDAALTLLGGKIKEAVTEDGEVDKKALSGLMTELVKENPWLVKPKDNDEGDKKPPKSGGDVGSGGKGGDKGPDEATLRRKYRL